MSQRFRAPGKVVRVAAVGLGWVTTHRHLPIMERDRRFRVVGVIDRRPGLAARIARERGYDRHAEAGDLAEVPWLDEVDAVTVGAAPFAHHATIGRALDAGKHVLTEKPFAMTVEEGEDLVRRASRAGRVLAIVHNFQFARSTKRLLADLDHRRYGRLRSIHAVQLGNPARRLPDWCERLPLGLHYDESPHLLYLIDRLAGELELSSAETIPASDGRATPAQLNLVYRSSARDLPVTVRWNFESPVSEWYLMVFGEEALGVVDLFRDLHLRLRNDGAHETGQVLRTSLVASWQHWSQHISRGALHVLGRLFYGTDEVFARFADGIAGDLSRLEPVGAERALAVLRMQHDVIRRQRPLWSDGR